MTDKKHPEPPQPSPGVVPPENDLTVDLTLEDDGVTQDLQSLADDLAADYEPAPAEAKGRGREGAGMTREELEAELERTRDRLEKLEKAESEHKDKHHRLLADFANHRNRVGRETQLAVTLAERKLLVEVLSVMDSLERCAEAKYNTLDDFHAGVALIVKQLQEVLRKAGVEPITVRVGDPFDAEHAEALTTTTQKSLPDGSVAAVYERGYSLRDQLLRPARVIVNNNPEPPQNPS